MILSVVTLSFLNALPGLVLFQHQSCLTELLTSMSTRLQAYLTRAVMCREEGRCRWQHQEVRKHNFSSIFEMCGPGHSDCCDIHAEAEFASGYWSINSWGHFPNFPRNCAQIWQLYSKTNGVEGTFEILWQRNEVFMLWPRPLVCCDPTKPTIWSPLPFIWRGHFNPQSCATWWDNQTSLKDSACYL